MDFTNKINIAKNTRQTNQFFKKNLTFKTKINRENKNHDANKTNQQTFILREKKKNKIVKIDTLIYPRYLYIDKQKQKSIVKSSIS